MIRITKKIKEILKQNREYLLSKVDIKAKPEKSLVKSIRRAAGRSSTNGRNLLPGRVTPAKRKYRIISFDRKIREIIGEVIRIEKDPNRSSFIALVDYKKYGKEYILSTENLKKGNKIIASKNIVEIQEGNCTKIINMPAGTLINNLEIRPNSRGKIIRSAGTSGQIIGFDKEYVSVKLPSKEVRKFHGNCMATVGIISNQNHINNFLLKASDSYYRGFCSKVRGLAKNAVDHPHGGGEGKGGTKRAPVNKNAVFAKGGKTSKGRNKRFIIQKRK